MLHVLAVFLVVLPGKFPGQRILEFHAIRNRQIEKPVAVQEGSLVLGILGKEQFSGLGDAERAHVFRGGSHRNLARRGVEPADYRAAEHIRQEIHSAFMALKVFYKMACLIYAVCLAGRNLSYLYPALAFRQFLECGIPDIAA